MMSEESFQPDIQTFNILQVKAKSGDQVVEVMRMMKDYDIQPDTGIMDRLSILTQTPAEKKPSN